VRHVTGEADSERLRAALHELAVGD
jgi:hypothetical protein